MRRVGIVALARRLLVALWRYLEEGLLPEGAELGGRLLDTPRIRRFGLRGMRSEEILRHFGEFATIECRFPGCIHLHEPECGVRAAVATGVLSEARYRSYVRIVSELEA